MAATRAGAIRQELLLSMRGGSLSEDELLDMPPTLTACLDTLKRQGAIAMTNNIMGWEGGDARLTENGAHRAAMLFERRKQRNKRKAGRS